MASHRAQSSVQFSSDLYSPLLHGRFMQYADITTALQHFNSLNLKTNFAKSNIVNFAMSSVDKYDRPAIRLADTMLEEVYLKFLGIYLNKWLTWNDHIDHICSKLTSGIYFLMSQANATLVMLVLWGACASNQFMSVFKLRKQAFRSSAQLKFKELCKEVLKKFAEETENGEETEAKENGEITTEKKKPAAEKKGKATKRVAAKPMTEPARKSSRTPKPVAKQNGEEESYEVEKLIDSREVRGKTQFLVRWKGYSRADDTWEDEKDLNCPELLQKFKAENTNAKSKPKKRSASKSPSKAPAKKAKSSPKKDYEVG
ncbi:hypothetical protein J6590_027441 [Homalodisca vitripennis]|nr:hypothetical protein J6590_027441 [Homalodisca vitripennis]